jgi:hypothetical protein
MPVCPATSLVDNADKAENLLPMRLPPFEKT